MNPKPVEQARTRELALALPALRRARQRAEEIAIATNTCIVEVHDGRIVYISPDELKARAAKGATDQMNAFEELLAAIRQLPLLERLRLIERARLEAAEDTPKAAGALSVDEFLAARLTPHPGTGSVSLDDMEPAWPSSGDGDESGVP